MNFWHLTSVSVISIASLIGVQSCQASNNIPPKDKEELYDFPARQTLPITNGNIALANENSLLSLELDSDKKHAAENTQQDLIELLQEFDRTDFAKEIDENSQESPSFFDVLLQKTIAGDEDSIKIFGFLKDHFNQQAEADFKSSRVRNIFLFWLKAAKAGLVSAMDDVGDCYYQGIGCHELSIDIRKERAEFWLREAAKAGNTESMSKLGYHLAAQPSTENQKEGLMWLHKAIELKNVEAMHNLGGCYSEGRGFSELSPTERNDQAAYWFEQAALAGSYEAMADLGAILFSKYGKKEKLKGITWLIKSAEAGDENAMDQLDEIIASDFINLIPSQYKAEILQALLKASSNGSGEAHYYLGKIYSKGSLCRKNLNEALRYFILAEEAGIEESLGDQYNLAYRFFTSDGCKDSLENKMQALTLYRKAIQAIKEEKCSIHVYFSLLGQCLQYPNIWPDADVEANNKEAIECFKAGAAREEPSCMGSLGSSYEKGLVGLEYPISKRMKCAEFWHKKAASKGNKLSCYALGMIYFRGAEGIDKNDELALLYLQKVKFTLPVSGLIAEIYISRKNYEVALENYMDIPAEQGINPPDRIVKLLRKRVPTAVAPVKIKKSKNTKINVARKAAMESAARKAAQELSDTQNRCKGLIERLSNINEGIESFNTTEALQELIDKRDALQKGLTCDAKNRDVLLEQLKQVVTDIENKLEELEILTEVRKNNKIAIKKHAEKQGDDIYSNLSDYSALAEQRETTRAIKEKAERTLAAKKRTLHKKNTRSHGTPNSANKAKADHKFKEEDKAEPVLKPFAHILKPDIMTGVQLQDNHKAKLYQIQDTIRECMNKEEVYNRLWKLEGAYDLEIVQAAYAGFPAGTIVFQMRLSKNYRVFIVWEPQAQQTQGSEGNSNDNPSAKTIYTLYGHKIYVGKHPD